MELGIQIDYCILKNPLSLDSYLVFITKRGFEYIDSGLPQEPQYNDIISLFNDAGLINIDYCMFEPRMVEGVSIVNKKSIIEKLDSFGAKYSKALEKNTVSEIEKIKKDVEIVSKILTNIQMLNSVKNKQKDFSENNQANKFQSRLIHTLPVKKYRIPEIGEKIRIYLYLFLACKIDSNENLTFMLNGDLISKKDKTFRGFIKIVDSDFVRTEGGNGLISLKSVKTHSQMLADSDILKNFTFDLAYPKNISGVGYSMLQKTNSLPFIEVIDKLMIEDKISIEVQANDFNRLVVHSKLIKKEQEMESKREKTSLKSKDVLKTISRAKKVLKLKMQELSEKEHYEVAAELRDKIKLLDKNRKQVNLAGEKISESNYDRLFSAKNAQKALSNKSS